MTYQRFEELPVWQAAMQLIVQIFKITEDRSFRWKGDLANQLQRAGLSVSNNVAEGFERGTTQELLTFLYIARGSTGEVRSILLVMDHMPAFAHLKSEISDLKSKAESISRQLRAWADSLQNSTLTGQRYLTEQSRRAYAQEQRGAAFWASIEKQHTERLEEIAKERERRTES